MGYAPNKKGYKCYNPQTGKFHVNIDVSCLENQPYFHKKFLQGENQGVEDNFWDFYVPLPNTILLEYSSHNNLETQTKELNVPNIGNIENPSLSLPSIDVTQTKGEVLQKNVNRLNFEFQVYTRRKLHHQTQNPTIILA